jgi:stage III sporulation protein AA
MYTAVETQKMRTSSIMNIMPSAIRRYMTNINLDEASEIRLITGKPFALRYPDGDYYLTSKSLLGRSPQGAVKVNNDHISEILERVTKSSLYSVQDEIRNGYITIEGGHRIGISGRAVTNDGKIEFVRNISALNIRIANEIKGIAQPLLSSVIRGGQVLNTLIISPPCAGKTTLLRDLTRCISDKGFVVGVADERCEISAMNGCRSVFDLGLRTVVMENCLKSDGIIMLLRSMSPEVIVTDELGTSSDAQAVSEAMNSGVAVIVSVHGSDYEQIKNKRIVCDIADRFDVIIVLSKRNGPGTVEEVIRL